MYKSSTFGCISSQTLDTSSWRQTRLVRPVVIARSESPKRRSNPLNRVVQDEMRHGVEIISGYLRGLPRRALGAPRNDSGGWLSIPCAGFSPPVSPGMRGSKNRFHKNNTAGSHSSACAGTNGHSGGALRQTDSSLRVCGDQGNHR